MNAEIPDELVARYQRDGFVVLKNFLTAAEVAELRAGVLRAMTGLGDQRVAGTSEFAEPAGYHDRVVVQRLNLWKVEQSVRRCVLDPTLGTMLRRLTGLSGVRLWHDQTFFKPPWGDPTAFHLDMPNWSFTSPEAISIWIALDHATVRNGCLHFLPGSHRKTRREANAGIRGSVGALFDHYPELRHVEAVPAEAEPGTAIFHNGLIAHAAGPNMTPYWRGAMTAQYMPEGATFNGNRCILTTEQMARLTVGDALDEDAFPLL